MNYVIGIVVALSLAFVFIKLTELVRQRTGFAMNRVASMVVGVVAVLLISYVARLTGLPEQIVNGLALGPAIGFYVGMNPERRGGK